MADRVRE